jgi:uncharacterized protein YlxW (UPF0749 family)
VGTHPSTVLGGFRPADGEEGTVHQHVAPGRRRPGLVGMLGVGLVLLLAGFLFVANAQIAGAGAERTPQDLPGLVQAEMTRTEGLALEVEALRAEVDELTDQLNDTGPEIPGHTDLVRLAAGRVAVTGPGLTVRLTDAPPNGPRPEWVVNDDLVVHQQDLQAVINALWAGGAEAMTLQDQRVISTSAFRCVGNVLLLHGRHYSPPYEVRAIGDPLRLEAALYDSPAVQTYLGYVEALGLGWSVTVEDDLFLPAYEGGLELEHATVPTGVTVAEGSP